MRRLWRKFLNLLKALFRQLKDKTNIIIFIIVFLSIPFSTPPGKEKQLEQTNRRSSL